MVKSSYAAYLSELFVWTKPVVVCVTEDCKALMETRGVTIAFLASYTLFLE